jgi:hypothetical protein
VSNGRGCSPPDKDSYLTNHNRRAQATAAANVRLASGEGDSAIQAALRVVSIGVAKKPFFSAKPAIWIAGNEWRLLAENVNLAMTTENRTEMNCNVALG